MDAMSAVSDKILDKFGVVGFVAPPSTLSLVPWRSTQDSPSRLVGLRTRQAVGESAELDRILALQRRPQVDLSRDGSGEYRPVAKALVAFMNQKLRLPSKSSGKCACASMRRPCLQSLLPVQAWALYEAPMAGGLLAPVGAGAGKSLIDIFLPLVMPDCKKAVVLIPPRLVEQFWDEYLWAREHFKVPSLIMPDGKRGRLYDDDRAVLHILPYSKLSRAESTVMLERLKPDLITADETHKLKNRDATTTGRVMKYFADHWHTRFCGMSGTVTSKSLKDYAHLSALALREFSPLPTDPPIVEEWALAIDPSDWSSPPGALKKLQAPGEGLYEGFHRRLIETQGVVATSESAVGNTLVLNERKPPAVPAKIQEMLKELRRTGIRPDGEELEEEAAVVAEARHLACGFYYHWIYPNAERDAEGKITPAAEAVIENWFGARQAWHRELRLKLQAHEDHLDSPFLCAQAAIRAYGGYTGELPVWPADTWPAWAAIKDQVAHQTEPVWVDDFLVLDAADWAKTHRGIVWYEYTAFGERLAQLTGLPLYDGNGDENELRAEKGDRSVIVSIKAHGTGTDGLQRIFSEALVANPPASGDRWEQALARLHRIGQQADEVVHDVYRHTAELADAIDRAVISAKYVAGTIGSNQKLLAANVTFKLASVND